MNIRALDEFDNLSILEISEIHIDSLTSLDTILAALGDQSCVSAGVLSQQELI